MTDRALRIGTMVKAGKPEAATTVANLAASGFESLQPFFWQTTGGIDLAELAKRFRDAIGDCDMTMPTLGVFGNPLEDDAAAAETRASWEAAIDAAHHFGADVVAGFAGRLRDKPIEASLPRFREIWGPLAKRAADRGVRIAFENCAMDGNWARGDWNIAHNPDAWALMFDAVPDENLGLEWEPCHQMVYLIDPMPQIRKWADRIFHVHGKDATIRRDVIREHGVYGRHPFVFMRTPGFGDCNWTDIISELRLAGYRGSIDIEGWHDPVYRDEMEMQGQLHALAYLKACRGGDPFDAYRNPS